MATFVATLRHRYSVVRDPTSDARGRTEPSLRQTLELTLSFGVSDFPETTKAGSPFGPGLSILLEMSRDLRARSSCETTVLGAASGRGRRKARERGRRTKTSRLPSVPALDVMQRQHLKVLLR